MSSLLVKRFPFLIVTITRTCVCVCVCMCVSACVCVCAGVHVSAGMWVCECVCARARVDACLLAQVGVCVWGGCKFSNWLAWLHVHSQYSYTYGIQFPVTPWFTVISEPWISLCTGRQMWFSKCTFMFSVSVGNRCVLVPTLSQLPVYSDNSHVTVNISIVECFI